MMKKLTFACLVAFTLFASTPASTFAASETTEWLDTSNVSNGYVTVNYNVPSHTRTKVMITKNDTSYTYDLNTVSTASAFPLQLGNGVYQVTLLENTSGNNYKKVNSNSLQLDLSDDNAVFLASTQNINWANSPSIISKARALTANAKNDTEKAQAIHDYITTKVKYDYAFAKNLPSIYVPDPAQTFVSNKGICYDYASLTAAMLRSVGVPTKLVMGNSTAVKEYHAWNEIYLDAKWVTVDTTVNASMKQAGKKVTLTANAAQYKAAKVY